MATLLFISLQIQLPVHVHRACIFDDNQGYDSLHQVMSVIPQYFNANGLFYCVANYIQHTFFSFIIKEYRNGNLISTLMRNEAIPFVGLVQNADTISGRIYHDLNMEL